mgnify:FL=1
MGSSQKDERCGARTRAGGQCASRPVNGKARCRMHGGASTGPRTPQGRRRIGEGARARYIAAALADGWVTAAPELRAAVAEFKLALGTHNGTANALGVTGHDLRRVLVGLPGRPQTLRQLETRIVAAARG